MSDEVVFEGLVDDLPKPEAPPEPDAMASLKDQINKLENEVKSSKTAASERDEVVDRFSAAIGFIEGTGVGKYDKETGQIIKVERQSPAEDPLKIMQEQISSSEKELMKQYKDGDITQGEYYQELQEKIAPLKDKYRDMQLDTKINKIKEELTPKEVKAEATKSNVHTEYDKLAVEYPDITTTESVLYKKMNDIYLKNSKLYANANQSSPNADPDQYRDLIERASIELKAEGVDIKKEQKNIRNKFASPEDQGYREPEKKGTEFTKQEVGMMVSQGINSKSLLADINKAVNQWGTTGIMVMED